MPRPRCFLGEPTVFYDTHCFSTTPTVCCATPRGCYSALEIAWGAHISGAQSIQAILFGLCSPWFRVCRLRGHKHWVGCQISRRPFWSRHGPCWGCLGAVLETPRAVLGPSWGRLGNLPTKHICLAWARGNRDAITIVAKTDCLRNGEQEHQRFGLLVLSLGAINMLALALPVGRRVGLIQSTRVYQVF